MSLSVIKMDCCSVTVLPPMLVSTSFCTGMYVAELEKESFYLFFCLCWFNHDSWLGTAGCQVVIYPPSLFYVSVWRSIDLLTSCDTHLRPFMKVSLCSTVMLIVPCIPAFFHANFAILPIRFVETGSLIRFQKMGAVWSIHLKMSFIALL